MHLCTPRRRRRFAGAERGSRLLQELLDLRYARVKFTEHAPDNPCRVLERRHGLVEIGERGGVVHVERSRVKRPDIERDLILATEDASSHGHYFSRQCPGFFEALQLKQGIRVVEGHKDALLVILAEVTTKYGVCVSIHL